MEQKWNRGGTGVERRWNRGQKGRNKRLTGVKQGWNRGKTDRTGVDQRRMKQSTAAAILIAEITTTYNFKNTNFNSDCTHTLEYLALQVGYCTCVTI